MVTYVAYSVYGIIVGVYVAVLRVLASVVFSLVNCVLLDASVLPERFAVFDGAYMSFMSVVMSHHARSPVSSFARGIRVRN